MDQDDTALIATMRSFTQKQHTGCSPIGPGLVPLFATAARNLLRAGEAGRDTTVAPGRQPTGTVDCGTDATVYYHYGCGTDVDFGWGCGYRCCQMLMSSLGWVSNSDSGAKTNFTAGCGGAHTGSTGPTGPAVPGIQWLQSELAVIGQIPQSDVGSTRWIDPDNVAALLNHLCATVPHVAQRRFKTIDYDVADSLARDRLTNHLRDHFQARGTAAVPVLPIMIDDGLKSYCVSGVAESGVAGEGMELLRLDPHSLGWSTFDDYTHVLSPAFSGSGGSVGSLRSKVCHHGVEWMPFDAVFYPTLGRQQQVWTVLWPTSSAVPKNSRERA